ncbi:Nodule Cysteine-Rich (NCR) secreted peptide [Medicago truncatula]|uniref:Nodule Cysteine-Rich (NCR) secreted peptide n=1 Tax=Medicago truncatula TaxID=3880 RepID=A0A072TDL0_MEDTR|nr:Nodule Cysteine-Rich (NCR) secreted peptide [Medicago truncatula]
MLIGKKMVETLKLIYVIHLFLSIFLFTNSPFGQIIFRQCKTDKDCPKLGRANIRCREGYCVRI